MAKVKDKETILKAARIKQVSYKGNCIRLSAYFSSGFTGERFKVLKEQNLQPRLLHPPGLSFRIEGDKEFPRQAKTKGVHNH